MRKILALAVAAAMTLSLAACGGPAAGGASSGSQAPGSASSADAAGDDFKVGAIYINSKNDTGGYTYAHHNGIVTAMNELGLNPETQLVIVDEVSEDYDAVFSAIDTLVGAGSKIIFGISFGYMDALNDAAEEYPDVIFSHATGYKNNDTNFNNYFGRIYQARYLAGVVAGLKSVELGNDTMGYVAAYGTQYAETCSGINAFALGAQSVNPNAVLYVKELGAWADEVNEAAFAQELISSYNAAVIAQHCDSAQPQIVAQDNGVFGNGYNSDMTAEAPDAHLSAPIWNWNVYYHTAIEAAMNVPAADFVSEMGGNAYYGGLAQDFVDVSPLTENCSENAQAIVDAVKELIISGEWDVFSGVKLSYDVAEDGTVTINQVPGALVTSADVPNSDVAPGTEIVPAGGPSVEDFIITGAMNYFVSGVKAG